MIRYALLCEDDHAFEAWFRDSEAFEVQSRHGDIGCPRCGSSKIRKAMMAPSILRSPNAKVPVSTGSPEVPVAFEAPATTDDEKFRHMRSMLRKLHHHVKENAEDVGRKFPDEARKISEGEAPGRAIYGSATPEEVSSLLDDGIEVLPLPPLPDDRN